MNRADILDTDRANVEEVNRADAGETDVANISRAYVKKVKNLGIVAENFGMREDS